MFMAGKPCWSAKSLKLDDNNICQELLSGNCRIECSPFISYHYYDHCNHWCKSFARCFNETGNQPWVDHCSLQFRQKMSLFKDVAYNNEASSFATRIHVRPCSLYVFVVSTWRCNCGVEDNQNGM